MKIRFAVLLALVFFAAPVFTKAAQMKLSDLRDVCASRGADGDAACQFYILGVTEGAGVGAGVANDKRPLICIPEGIPLRDLVLTVKKEMMKDLAVFPQDKDMPAVSFVTAVMMRTYACRK